MKHFEKAVEIARFAGAMYMWGVSLTLLAVASTPRYVHGLLVTGAEKSLNLANKLHPVEAFKPSTETQNETK